MVSLEAVLNTVVSTATLRHTAAFSSLLLRPHCSTDLCRGLFATHYHRLAEDHVSDPAVSIRHMAAAIEPATPENGGFEQVCLLHSKGSAAKGWVYPSLLVAVSLAKCFTSASPKLLSTY